MVCNTDKNRAVKKFCVLNLIKWGPIIPYQFLAYISLYLADFTPLAVAVFVVVLHSPKFSFEVGILAIFGHLEDDNYRDELMKNYSMVNRGYNSFLTNIPGTIYKKALKVSKK